MTPAPTPPTAPTPRGVFVGLTTLDLVQRVDRYPGVNDKVVARRSDVAAGGPAATAALTFRALGGHSVLLSVIGPGPIGHLAAGELAGRGVAVVDGWSAGGDLSVSAITVLDSTGERAVVSRNAADLTTAPPAELPGVLRGAEVVLLDGHHPGLAVLAVRAAREHGTPVVLDCGSAKPVYRDLVPLADAVICSAVFSVAGRTGFEAVSAVLLDQGAGLVAMTDGPAPVRWRTPHADGIVEVPAVAAQDTLGAGDVLHGAFAFARACGALDAKVSLTFGVAVASLRVQHIGPRSWLDDGRLTSYVATLRKALR